MVRSYRKKSEEHTHAHVPATKQPVVMIRMDITRVNEGNGRRRMTTARIRLTRGVHRFTAPYIGMFIPKRGKNEESIFNEGRVLFSRHPN